MTISYPEPGDLVKTVADLVTAVNAGGGGGGSAFFDLFQTSTDGVPVSLPDGSPHIISFDPTFGEGAYTRSQGTALSFSASNPSRVTIAEAGYYNIHVAAILGKGSEDYTAVIVININGVQTALTEFLEVFVQTTDLNVVGTHGRLWKYQMAQGDYFEADITQVGNSSEDNTLQLATITVTREA